MNAAEPRLPAVRGLIDRDGRLVDADQRLHDLNARAGGAIGLPLAVPQLATLARLAQRLGIMVSRGVIAADGDDDLDLWVRAQPDAPTGGVRLAITGWHGSAAWHSSSAPTARTTDFLLSDADFLWETDSAHRLTFLSESASVRYGVDMRAVLGQPLTRLFLLDESDPIFGSPAMQRGFDEQRARIRDTGRSVRLAAIPRSAASGVFIGLVGAAYMLDEAPLSEAKPVPDTATAAAGAFAARLDQALRLPLSRIIANADSIHAQSEGPLRQDYADYAADIASAGRHLLALVDDLVDLQAIERPDFVVSTEPLDLADVARRAAGLLQVRATEAKVSVERPALGHSLAAMGEFRRALQVLVNLIGNALRYSPDGGTVWIRAERDGDKAVIIVADQGRGIALEDQARIFEKFERVDPAEPGGSGLGLYIARRLARAMGGDVTVDSAPDQGARFVFTLPLA